jgi:hypothetical protein
LITDKNRLKMNIHDHHIQELWDMIKSPNLRIHGVKERAEI